MRYLDLTLQTPAENLALDETLLLAAEAGGGEILRVWEWPRPAVVVGSGCKLVDDVDLAACQSDDVPVLRRSSGGGTVLLSKGCLLYTLVLDQERTPELREIRSSYAHILARVRQALFPEEEKAAICGVSDLAIGERKFSGNAQQRKRRHILHHGTLLYSFDIALATRYLLLPPRQPEYRNGRSHADFLCNLSLSGDELKQRLQGEWRADEQQQTWPQDEVIRLVTEKYGTKGWVERR